MFTLIYVTQAYFRVLLVTLIYVFTLRLSIHDAEGVLIKALVVCLEGITLSVLL